MNCESCKNYAPKEQTPKQGRDSKGHFTGKQAKQKPRTTVTVWADASTTPFPMLQLISCHLHNGIRQYTYSFDGLPDIDMVIEDTLEHGALAVKVECTERFDANQYDMGIQITGFYAWKVDLNLDGIYHEILHCNTLSYCGNKCVITSDADIEAAITAYLGKQKPKSAHKDGERCELTATTDKHRKPPQKHHFEYTGEYRAPHKDEWMVSAANTIQTCDFDTYDANNPIDKREILRLVIDKPEPQFKVGDVVGYKYDTALREVIRVHEDGWIDVKYPDGDTFIRRDPAGYRLATPDELDTWYTREIEGVKVRLYEMENGDVLVLPRKGASYLLFPDGRNGCARDKVFLAGLRALNLPVQPYSQSKGDYKPPKG